MQDETYTGREPLDAAGLRAGLSVCREMVAEVDDEVLRNAETREAALRLSELITHRLRVTS